jgi:imidazolonepropionase-like amidohydrolase
MFADADSRTAAPRVRCLLIVLLAWLACANAAPFSERHAIAITDVTVIDVEKGRSIGPRTVLIDEGRIVAIVAPAAADIPAKAERLDGRWKFLIPGLVDMHVHLFNNYSRRSPNDWAFPLFVANGVTAVREMNANAASIAIVRRWRKELDAGELVAPRILAAGISVHGKSPSDAAVQVHAAADAGADFIKVFSDVPEPNWRAILDAARARSLPVSGHVPAGVALLDAAAADQRTDEHLMQAYEACSSVEASLLEERRNLEGDALVAKRDEQEPRALEAFDQRTCERVGRKLAASGQVQVPTLVLAHDEATRGAEPARNDPRWRYLREDERARWERNLAGVSSADHALAKRRWDVSRRIASAFHSSGVPMLAGTDTPMPGNYPGFSLHDELALLVEAGFTPLEALRAATLAPSQFLGMAGATGTVSAGQRADLVLLDADPTRDIRNTRRIHAVLLNGRLLRRTDLDALLDNAASAQAR